MYFSQSAIPNDNNSKMTGMDLFSKHEIDNFRWPMIDGQLLEQKNETKLAE